MWWILCRVQGGVTDTREAPLRDANGKVQHFATQEEAEAGAEAARLRARVRGGAARFDYFPMRTWEA